MIRELFDFIRTPALPLAKKWGYLYQSISLEKRYERCSSPWLPHLYQCHQFLKKHAPENAESICILGSGLAVEIPRDWVIAKFKKIYLVDLIHPLSVRKWAHEHPQVELIESDVTGWIEALDQGKSLEDIKKTKAPQWPEADFLVSANVISQLPHVPILRFHKKWTEQELMNLGTALIEIHLQHLKNHSGRALYWTDTESTALNQRGEKTSSHSTVLGLNLPGIQKEWIWNFSPLGEDSSFSSKQLKVVAGSL